jgi:hypothetical protein
MIGAAWEEPGDHSLGGFMEEVTMELGENVEKGDLGGQG